MFKKPSGWFRGVVNLPDLPSENIYVNLKQGYKERILITARNICGSWVKLAKKINEPFSKHVPYTIHQFKRGSKARLSLVLKILYLIKENKPDFSLEDAFKNISEIGGKTNNHDNVITNPKIPFDFRSEYGARIISAVLHDGGIKKTYLEPFYSNKDLGLKTLVEQSFKNIFGEIKSKQSKTINGRQYILFPRIIGVILVYGLGLTLGKKVLTNPSVPKFIFDCNENIRRIFLRQAYSDEGNVSDKTIRFSLSVDVTEIREKIRHFVPELLKEDKQLIESLDIKVSGPIFIGEYVIKENNKIFYRHTYGINISSKKALEAFKDKIGFDINYKSEKLKKEIESIREEHFTNFMNIEEGLFVANKLQKDKGHFTIKDLSLELNRSHEQARRIINKLMSRNIVKVKSTHEQRPREYVINNVR